MKEADKLACLVLFFLFPVSQYCEGTFWGQRRRETLTERCSEIVTTPSDDPGPVFNNLEAEKLQAFYFSFLFF